MFNFRRFAIILLSLVALVLLIQFFRIDFINSSVDTDLLDVDDLVIKTDNRDSVEKYLIITDTESETLNQLLDQMTLCLSLMKVHFDTISVEAFRLVPDDYDMVVLNVVDLSLVSNLEGLIEYVEEGGNLIVPYRLEFGQGFSGLFRYFGITEFGAFTQTEGVVSEENFFVGASHYDEEWSTGIYNEGLSVQLNDQVKILLSTFDDVSLLWKYSLGKGQMFYFNGTMLSEKKSRGFLMSLLNCGREYVYYPIIGGEAFILEDVPSPIASGNDPYLFEDYERSTLRFYKEIWMPDILEFGKRFNMKFTSSLLGTYDDFSDKEDDGYFYLKRENLSLFGREILMADGEIGLGGFNNTTLVVGDDWTSLEEIENGIDNIIEYFKVVFVKYDMATFLPISNTIDPSVIELLNDRGFRVFLSRYFQSSDNLTSEYSVNEDYVEIPIILEGYDLSNDRMWIVFNELVLRGAYVHAIAFDDVFKDSYREMGWKVMYEHLYDYYDLIDEYFGFVKPMTVSDLSKRTIDYTNEYPELVKDELSITLISEGVDNYYYIQIIDTITSVVGGKLTELEDGFYLLHKTDKKVVIELE